MEGTELIEHLEESGVMSENEEVGTFELTEEFEETTAKFLERFEAGATQDFTSNSIVNDQPGISAILTEIYERNPTVVADFLSLCEYLGSTRVNSLIRGIVILDYLRKGAPRSHGAPQGFLPVHGDLVAEISSFVNKSLIFVWRADCTPCETVRADLEELREEGGLDGIMQFAIYGPGHIETLKERFGVVGGPTTLFVSKGSVDSRLIGVPPKGSIQNEIAEMSS